jgi:hypothetical protein
MLRKNSWSLRNILSLYADGKFETLDADIALAFKYIGIDGIVKFPQRKTFYKKTKSSEEVHVPLVTPFVLLFNDIFNLSIFIEQLNY